MLSSLSQYVIHSESRHTWDKQHDASSCKGCTTKDKKKKPNHRTWKYFPQLKGNDHPQGFITEHPPSHQNPTIPSPSRPRSPAQLQRFYSPDMSQCYLPVQHRGTATLTLSSSMRPSLSWRLEKSQLLIFYKTNLSKGKINGYKHSLSILNHSKSKQRCLTFQHLLSSCIFPLSPAVQGNPLVFHCCCCLFKKKRNKPTGKKHLAVSVI